MGSVDIWTNKNPWKNK